jgi:uncharacterized SAM-binding protein YcdF (DUF218 family)
MDNDINLAQTIWDWLPVRSDAFDADFMFVMGNASRRLPVFAAELYLSVDLPFVLISGGKGRLTQNEGGTEAARYKQSFLRKGITSEAIILEEGSENTYENIILSKKLLESRSIRPSSGLAVTTALMSRRHEAMLSKLWPEVTWGIATPPPQGLQERLKQDGNSQFIDLLVGRSIVLISTLNAAEWTLSSFRIEYLLQKTS